LENFGAQRVADAVDLPCYAGKRRAVPLHLAAALAARDRGIAVLVHGPGVIEGRLTAMEALQDASVPTASSLVEAASMLRSEGIACIDIAHCCPQLAALLALRTRLGVRSFAHSVARLLNPLQCRGQINGFFHAPYGARMAQANRLLGQTRSLLMMGAEGEPELYADRQKLLLAQRGDDEPLLLSYAAAGAPAYPRQASSPAELRRQWQRVLAGAVDPREEAVLGRMAAAFDFAAGGGIPFSCSSSS